MTVALVTYTKSGEVRPFCSGVWVGPTTILTANHCVADDEPGEEVLYAILSDTMSDPIMPHIGTMYVHDEDHDLALLRTPPTPFNHAVARLSQAPVVQGQQCFTMGMPLGLWWSFSSGDIASVRLLDTGHGMGELEYVQVTAPISPGNSGGGLFNSQGLLIGIAHAQMPRGQNLNLYTSGTYVKALLAAKAK